MEECEDAISKTLFVGKYRNNGLVSSKVYYKKEKKCKINLEITRDLGDILTNCNGRLRLEPDNITKK